MSIIIYACSPHSRQWTTLPLLWSCTSPSARRSAPSRTRSCTASSTYAAYTLSWLFHYIYVRIKLILSRPSRNYDKELGASEIFNYACFIKTGYPVQRVKVCVPPARHHLRQVPHEQHNWASTRAGSPHRPQHDSLDDRRWVNQV